jgi:hypothetical protein
MATKQIVCPDGMSGLMVVPWSANEIYAVAANWAQASSPVMTYADDGWEYDRCGRQVADFRHSPRAALEDVIRTAISMGGDKPDDDEVESIIDDATDVGDADAAKLEAMAVMLTRHGDRFAGNSATDIAADWIGNDFGVDDAAEWCEIGCWDADTAAKLRDAGLSAQDARDAADKLAEACDDAAEEYTDGDPIYSVCNADTRVQVIIDAAKNDD